MQEIIEENIEENNKKKCGDKMNIEEMSNKRKEILKELLKKYENIFKYKLGKIKEIKHEIEINERQESILRRRYEKIKEKGINELQEKVNKLFRNIIEI
jgi:cell division protein FtsB